MELFCQCFWGIGANWRRDESEGPAQGRAGGVVRLSRLSMALFRKSDPYRLALGLAPFYQTPSERNTTCTPTDSISEIRITRDSARRRLPTGSLFFLPRYLAPAAGSIHSPHHKTPMKGLVDSSSPSTAPRPTRSFGWKRLVILAASATLLLSTKSETTDLNELTSGKLCYLILKVLLRLC